MSPFLKLRPSAREHQAHQPKWDPIGFDSLSHMKPNMKPCSGQTLEVRGASALRRRPEAESLVLRCAKVDVHITGLSVFRSPRYKCNFAWVKWKSPLNPKRLKG